ncbi:MAG: hypothetical protein AAGA96_13770 [Verrucomicrobiota bacterium]
MKIYNSLGLVLAVTFAGGLATPSLRAQSGSQAFQDEVSYSNDIQPVVKNFCTTCHAGDDPEGDLVLTSYADVKEHTLNGDLLGRINDADDPMPEDGLMPKHLRRLFQTWADNGYLEKGTRPPSEEREDYGEFDAPKIVPFDITSRGFEMLEKMQGHWVGSMDLMGTHYDWMAFDYRAISPAHVHGIFEGGTIGNLFTSFFVAEFKGTRTLMARNGGVLNGIYRTSYFVLEDVQGSRRQTTYRFVDAYGGRGIMSMDLTFSGERLEFSAYTSRLGLKAPSRHMHFKAKRTLPELSAQAAAAVGFPVNQVEFTFPAPLPQPTWVGEYPMTSATYISEEPDKTLEELGSLAKDPIRIDQMPHLSRLTVSIDRGARSAGQKLLVFLSHQPLTDAQGKFLARGGYIRLDHLDTLTLFPELSTKANDFTFTYLHPGDYYLTVIADLDRDGFPGLTDLTHPVTPVVVAPETHEVVEISLK